jgi:hypothetical protein
MIHGHGKITIEEAMKLPLEYYEYVTPLHRAEKDSVCCGCISLCLESLTGFTRPPRTAGSDVTQVFKPLIH